MSSNDRVRVGWLTFTPTSFGVVTLLGFIFAGTAGAFMPQLTPGSGWLELLSSGHMLTLVLFLGLAWFICRGIASWRPALLPMARLALSSFLGAHVATWLWIWLR